MTDSKPETAVRGNFTDGLCAEFFSAVESTFPTGVVRGDSGSTDAFVESTIVPTVVVGDNAGASTASSTSSVAVQNRIVRKSAAPSSPVREKEHFARTKSQARKSRSATPSPEWSLVSSIWLFCCLCASFAPLTKNTFSPLPAIRTEGGVLNSRGSTARQKHDALLNADIAGMLMNEHEGESFWDEELPIGRSAFGKRFRSTKRPSQDEKVKLVFHAKGVDKFMDVSAVVAMMNPAIRPRFEALLAWYRDSAFLEKHCSTLNSEPASDVLGAHADKLCSLGFCTQISETEVRQWGRGFTVKETKEDDSGGLYERLRFIFHPSTLNECLPFQSGIELNTTSEHIAGVFDGNFAIVRDLAISYFQVKLSPEASRYYCFRDDEGRVWCMNVMPMGARPSGEIMDMMLKTIAGAPGYSIDSPPVHVSIQTHIDNLRGVVACHEDGARYAAWVDHRAKLVSATFNRDNFGVHSKGPFCGLEFDYESKTVRALPKTANKMARAEELMSKTTVSVGEILEITGVLFFLSTCLRIDVAKFYFAMKAYRRVASKVGKGEVSESDPVPLTKTMRKQYQSWIALAKRNTWTTPERPGVDCGYTLYSDASKKGWGMVMIRHRDQQVFSVGGSWSEVGKNHNINTLEAVAILEGLHAFKDEIAGKRILLRVDNTSAAHSVRKAYARAYYLNRVVAKINDVLRAANVSIADVEYIDTTSNVSDAVSRGATDVDSAQVLATHNDIDEHMKKLATGSTRDGGAGRRQRQVRMYRRQAQGRE